MDRVLLFINLFESVTFQLAASNCSDPQFPKTTCPLMMPAVSHLPLLVNILDLQLTNPLRVP